MTRVKSRRSQFGDHRATALDRTRVIRKKKPYKILLESVYQEKKKLHSILTYTANAPLGYSFVPAGDPDLSEYCKEQCRKRNLDVHIVSAKPRTKAHADPERISHHVHRIGYHFPNEVISEACDILGYYFRNGVYQKRAHNHDKTRFARILEDHGQRMQLNGRPATEMENKTQVRDAVRDMFPKIPEADLSAIVHHAFEEGSKRVGNATELTLARRAQLAVVAHIRHTYTEYDRLLKVGTWIEARAKVEHVSLAKLREWRDEGDNGEFEETFREVIVIDDDEDSSSDDDSISVADQREPSLEIISSRATARELQHNELDDVTQVDAHSVSRAPRRTIFLRPTPPGSRSSALGTYTNAQVPRAYARPPPLLLPLRLSQDYGQPLHSRPIDARPRNPAFEPLARSQHPLQMRGEDGQLYDLQPIQDTNGHSRVAIENRPPRVEHISSSSNAARYARERYVQTPQRVNSFESKQPSRVAPPVPSRRPSEQDTILPSVEREPEPIASPRQMVGAQYQFQQGRSLGHVSYPSAPRVEAQTPKRKELYSMYEAEDRYREQISKRSRPAYTEAEALAPFWPPDLHRSRDCQSVQSRPRIQPSRYEVVDLTSSPIQSPHHRNRDGHVVPVRSYTTTRSDNSHALGQTRGYYEPSNMDSRSRLPFHLKMDERYAPLRDHIPVREEPRRPQSAAGGRATRSGLVYGGYELH